MIAKFRHSLGLHGEWTFKKISGAMIFLAIIVVFIGFNVRNDTGSDNTGGAAATVNEVAIPYPAFRAQAEERERMITERLGDLPEAQRKLYTASVRAQVLENLITAELIFQVAQKHGVTAADGAVRDTIASVPFFQDNGVFQRERYRLYLQQSNSSASDFERTIRKDLVTQKTYDLFLGSVAPAREELARNRRLANQKVSLRFAELNREDLAKLARVTDAEAVAFDQAHGAEVETYYRDNKIEFTKPARYHARDLLVRIDGKRDEAAARKVIDEIAGRVTAANFAQVAAKSSEDPGSKAKGGDLGDRDQGSLPASFETPVLALKVGEVSKPIKVDGGYHLVLLESKQDAGTAPIERVRADIARKLMARSRQEKVLADVKALVATGDRRKVEPLLGSIGVKWQTPAEFDLTTATIPKLGDAKDVLRGVVEAGGPGLIPRVMTAGQSSVIVDVTAFKQIPDAPSEAPGIERMVAARRAEGAFEAWIKDVEKRATIVRNTRLLE